MKFPTLLLSVLFLSSCVGTDCEFSCQNGGVCIDVGSDCAVGYEGVDCSHESRTKFIGSYLMRVFAASDVFVGSLPDAKVTIEKSATSVRGMTINGLELNILETDLEAIVHYDDNNMSGMILTFDVTEKTVSGYTYSGNGSLHAATLSLVITEVEASNNLTFVYTLTGPKQP